MYTAQHSNLIRKQYMLSEHNIQKLEKLAKGRGTSAAEVVRLAIDAYDPDGLNASGETEFMSLVSTRLKEAIEDTKKTRKRLNRTLSRLKSK